MLCQVWPAAASLHSLCQLSGSQGSGGPPGCCRRRKLEFLTIVLKQFPGLLPIPTWWSSVMWKISTWYSELGGLGRWLPSLRTSMESLGCSRKQLGCIRQQCTWLYLPFFESSKVSKHQVKKKLRDVGIQRQYMIALLKLDPKRLSQPVTRRRIYICLVRRNLG